MANVKEITIREKAAVIYHLVTGEPWTDCYKIASPESFDKIAKSKFITRYASAWKNSHKIQEFAQQFNAIQEAKRDKEINEAIEKELKKEGSEESERRQGGRKGGQNIVDYSDPKNRQRLYNEVIAQAKDDPRTQLDAAKLFEQIQKDDREAAKAQKQSRVYLPLTCRECPLYIKKATK